MAWGTYDYGAIYVFEQLRAMCCLRKLTTTYRLERVVPRFFMSADVRARDHRNSVFVSIILVILTVLGD